MAIGDPVQNPFEDRITQILQERAQPQTFTPGARDAAALASQYMAQAGQGQGVDQILGAIGAPQREQQQRELESATALYDLFEQKRAAGDAQANALFNRISMFTGGDPEGTRLFLEELNADPEEIDPGNAFQVMSKLAGIAKRTGYKSPESRLQDLQIRGAEQDVALGGLKLQKAQQPPAPEYLEIKGQPGFVRLKGTAQAVPIEGIPADALVKADVKEESQLRKEYLGQVKPYKEVERSYQRVIASAEDPSPAGDLALIFNYMKVLDPGSTVREGEFATAQNSGSVPARIVAQYNRVLEGRRLSDTQRDDFVDRATRLYDAQIDLKSEVDIEYRSLAESYGFNADRIVTGEQAQKAERGIGPLSPQEQEELDRLRAKYGR